PARANDPAIRKSTILREYSPTPPRCPDADAAANVFGGAPPLPEMRKSAAPAIPHRSEIAPRMFWSEASAFAHLQNASPTPRGNPLAAACPAAAMLNANTPDNSGNE